MSISRQDRLADFQVFFQNATGRIDTLKNSNARAQQLEPIYSFYVAPGSRAGGQNHRVVDVFFGSRPIDFYVSAGRRTAVSEFGASLIIERDDNAHVAVLLYPAYSDNRRPRESCILLRSQMDPKELVCGSFLNTAWKDLMAYMEVTCLEGAPTWQQRWRIFWLRLTRSLVVETKTVPSSLYTGSKEILKYVLTIGLSGFLIYLFAPDASKGTVKELRNISEKMDSLKPEMRNTDHSHPELQAIITYMDSIQAYNTRINETLNRIEARTMSKTATSDKN